MKNVTHGWYAGVALSMLFHIAAMSGYGRMFSVSGASYPVAQLAVNLPTEVERRSVVAPVPNEAYRGAKKRAGAPAVSNTQHAPLFVSSEALDKAPEVIKDIADEIPILSEYPLGGWAVLVLDVGKEGEVDNVLEVQSDLSPQNVEALRQEFLRVRFRPGTVNGQPVKFSLRIQVGVNPLDRANLILAQ